MCMREITHTKTHRYTDLAHCFSQLSSEGLCHAGMCFCHNYAMHLALYLGKLLEQLTLSTPIELQLSSQQLYFDGCADVLAKALLRDELLR